MTEPTIGRIVHVPDPHFSPNGVAPAIITGVHEHGISVRVFHDTPSAPSHRAGVHLYYTEQDARRPVDPR